MQPSSYARPDVEAPQLQGKASNQHPASPDSSISNNRSKIKAFLKNNAFLTLTLAAVAFGVGLGFALRRVNMTARQIAYLSFPGELLMRMLQLLVLPLLISSLITGISSVDKKAYGKTGLRAFGFYVLTTLLAAFTGIGLAVLIQPGKWSRQTTAPSSGNMKSVHSVDAFLDLIRNMIPLNMVEAFFRKYKTVYSRSDSAGQQQGLNNLTETYENVPLPGISDGVNILGLLVISVAFGLVLGSMESDGKPLRDFFDCLNKATMHLVNKVIWYSPVGILFLIAGQILKMMDPKEIGGGVAMYTLSVISGLFIHSFITLPLIYLAVTRKNPFRFMLGLLQALTTAFGTSSSSATLPVTLHCMEENHNMDKKVTRSMLPMGATLNMDGAALYEAVAALFIAQIHNIDFNFGQIIVLSLIVTAASTGAAGIPQAGMVSMVIVLTSTGLPTEDISLLMIVDWILDRLRTATNVLGDCVGVAVVHHLSRHELQSSAEGCLV